MSFISVLVLVASSSAKATTVHMILATPKLATQVDVQCKIIMGNRICREVGGSKKQTSSAKKSGANKKQANKKSDGKAADIKKQNEKRSESDRADVDFGPVEQKPTQTPPSNDNVLWGDLHLHSSGAKPEQGHAV